jgi:hypothetical protein
MSIEDYLNHLDAWVPQRMEYHNNNGDLQNTIAIGEEFFELYDPSSGECELLYLYRLKTLKPENNNETLGTTEQS